MENANLLAHIPDEHLDAKLLHQFCHDFSFAGGLVKVHVCADLSVPQITIDVYLRGVRIGGGILDKGHPKLTFQGAFHGFKAQVDIEVDFATKTITYEVTVCAPIVGCRTFKGKYTW